MITQLNGNTEMAYQQMMVPKTSTTERTSSVPTKPIAANHTEKKASTQDSVVLSETAKTMSRSLTELTREMDTRSQEKKSEEEAAAKKAATDVVNGKYYPPFLDNKQRLELLKYNPQLLKELKAMMVPPPFDAQAGALETPSPAETTGSAPTVSS